MPSGVYDRSNQTNWKPNSGRFKKGEHRNPDTEFKKGIHPKNAFKQGVGSGIPWELRCGSEQWYKLQSESHKGQHSSPETEIKPQQRLSLDTEFKRGQPQIYIPLGSSRPEFSKDKHPNWQGGLTEINNEIRNSGLYHEWRFKVFKRDNFICQRCGHKSCGDIEAHHIKSFTHYPELRFDVNNGETLCEDCHKPVTKAMKGGDAKCRQANDLR